MPTSLRVTIAALLTALFMAPGAVQATNDPFWGQQWALRKMGVTQAWERTRGEGIVVGVVDTGVDLKHPDLQGRLLRGKDFVDGDDTPQDENGHGTHMAGTIAAIAGNAVGVASVAPGTKILPVRVLDASGQSDDPASVADGIRWAVDHGARVVNLSLAQDGPSGISVLGADLLADSAIDDAIRYVTDHGAVAVVASGNTDGGGKPATSYTAKSPGAIVVGASTISDQRAAYSNYGPGLDVLAPGGGSATDPDFTHGCQLSNSVVGLYWNPKTKKSDYAGACGTSVAVAHVSGLAAMLMARGYNNAQAVARIKQTATDIAPKGKDAQSGFGRVDAAKAIGSSTAPPKQTAAQSSAPPRVQQGRVGPAGRTVTSVAPSPSSKPSSGLPPQALRTLAEGEDRSIPVTIAAVLALAVGMAHSRVRRRLKPRV